MYEELKASAETVSFSLDVWKTSNKKYILAVICHWATEDFEDCQLVIHFGHLKGSHTGENMAKEIQEVLQNFDLEQKLVAICGDNASNNPTLCCSLHKLLKQRFVDSVQKLNLLGEDRKLMCFRGDKSFVRCLAHVLNLIAKSMLKIFKVGSHQEAKRRVDKYMEYASVALDYNVDTQWNALLKMLEIAIRERSAINCMCKEYDHFDDIIKLQGAYASIDIQIQDTARVGRKALDKYTKKMDAETLIIYSAAVLDSHIKTELLKIHLGDNAIDVINNLRVHFNEISPAPEPTLPSSC
ncbi:hypothetical protein TSTA_017170 [Talaromyces stipitatus ATCC 10500]|uniref:AC transposase n=1 Tax=Talaromyces stipitatus (strain ATCC 10500 / CBS 375.48 / QM 6759 / NRRL 1006) TaxID=441959 RepID=B8MEL5_TALSN|nr:uncharacterized protein TSTA_017170 [Talaromyces stipitatus ATCC 10500]EED16642.1 hypothetical protein TSTA_017170 [Talaromyces stipitatus ATCC 10500]